MNKIFKKSLALTVSAALCLTAFIGCLSVSAEEPVASSATITVKDTTIAPGATGDVDVEFANVGDICATLSTITFPEGFVINSIKDNAEKQLFKVLDETDGGNVIINKNVLKFCEIINFAGQISTTNVILTINVTAPETAGTYTVKVGESSANYDEKFLAITTKEGTVTVASSCVHDYEVVAATPAEYDESNVQTKAGSIVFRCSECGDEVTKEVSFSTDSNMATANIGCTAQTLLMLKMSTAKYGDSTNGYVEITNKHLNGSEDSHYFLNISKSYINGNYRWWDIGVQSNCFTEDFVTTFYSERNGKWYSGTTKTTSIKAAAMNTLKSAGQSESVKKVAADMLVMGKEAQKLSNYATDKLADADIWGSDYEQYVTKTTPTVEKDTSRNWITHGTEAGAKGDVSFATPAITMDASMTISMKANMRNHPIDENLRFMISYTDYKGDSINKPVAYTVNDQGRPVLDISLNAPELRELITIQAFSGETAISDKWVYSVESILAHAKGSNTDGKYDSVINAVMNYADSAAANFNN